VASQLERRNNVANLGNDYPNDDADPIDSAPPRAAILHHGSTAKERAAGWRISQAGRARPAAEPPKHGSGSADFNDPSGDDYGTVDK